MLPAKNKLMRPFLFPFLVLVAAVWTSSTFAQETGQASIRQSAVFLEQIVGSWGMVLKKWDRDATTEDWKAARQNCQEPVDAASAELIAGAAAEEMPQAYASGSIVYYRAAQGLQQFNAVDNQILLYPNLRIGRNQSGIAYQISGLADFGLKNLIITIGKVQTDSGVEVVMVHDGALLLKCQQPTDGQTN